MRIAVTSAAGLALLVATPAFAQQDQPLRFAPDTEWALDYGDDYCRLMRGFAQEGNELTLVLDRIQPGPVVRMMISGTGLSTPRRARTLGFKLKPSEAARETAILRADAAGGGSVYNLGDVYIAPYESSQTREDQRALRARYSRSDELAYAGGVEGITLDSGVSDPLVLETGNLAAPMEALQACADELVTHWDLDPEKHRNLRRPVVPANDMATWLPAGTIGRGQTTLLMGGQNQARLMINAEGVPTDCAIHFASLPEETNEKICAALVQNARFTPAQDANGAAMDSYWITQLNFLAR